MARNAIQFQKGLSEVAYQENYGTEDQCKTVLEAIRLSDGFVCPECGDSKGHRLDSRNLYQCASCRRQASLTAGTVFEHTKLPLSIWFHGTYHRTQSKIGVLAMGLIRRGWV